MSQIQHSTFHIRYSRLAMPAILLAALLLQFVPLSARAATYDISEIKFEISAPNNLYRVVGGDEDAKIPLTVSLAEGKNFLKGDKVVKDGDEYEIQGFYAAASFEGTKAICGIIKCDFTAETAKSDTASFTKELIIKTNKSRQTIKYWLYPVLALNNAADDPFTNRPLTITVEVYPDAASIGSLARAEGGKTSVVTSSGGSRAISPNKIEFEVKTNFSTYRVVAGEEAAVGVEVNLTANSEKVRFNGTDELAKSLATRNPDIDGLYAAAGPSGTKDYCFSPSSTAVLPEECQFLEKTGPIKHAVPYKETVRIETGKNQNIFEKVVNLNGSATGNSISIDIFPVIDTNLETDEPFANKPAKITVKVFDNNDNLLKDCGHTPGATGEQDRNCRYSGAGSSSTTSSPTAGESRSIAEILSGSLLSVVNIIIGVIAGILRWIIWTLGNFIFVPLLETTLNMTADDIAGGPIMAGWTFVRHVVNMFFILGLIVIGLGTILKIESYNYKKLLVTLIIMAMLVNFSLVIGKIIIQIADAIQFSFLPGNVEMVNKQGEAVSGISGVKYLFQMLVTVHGESIVDGIRSATLDTSEALGATFSIIFQLILELGVIITFGALAVFMLIRTVALWILLILSPVAYALFVLPGTRSIAQKWWSNFLKYAMFAPIIAFFLRLVLALYQQGLAIIPKGLHGFDQQAANRDLIDYISKLSSQQGGVSIEQSLSLAMIYIVILAFLWAGLAVTKQMGIAGAGAIMNFAQKGMTVPFVKGKRALVGKNFREAIKTGKGGGLLGMAYNFAGEKVLQKYRKEIRPHKWIEGWKESREANRLAREEAGLAGAAGKSVLANPTSFFQRYWSPKGIGKAITGKNKRGQRMLTEAARDDEIADELEQEANAVQDQIEEKKKIGITDPALQAKADDLKTRATALRQQAVHKAEEAKHMVHDPDYFTQRKLREAKNHERSKVLGETWQELNDLAEGAVEEKHVARFQAIFEKLADTFNENELLTHWKYTGDMKANETGGWKDLKSRELMIKRALKTRKDAYGKDITEEQARTGDFNFHRKGDLFHEDKSGWENFRKQILVEKLGMSDAESMRHIADIGDIAAKRGHTGIWRLYNTKNGIWRMNPYDEWDTEMRIEKGKMTENDFSGTNRLNGADEYTGKNGYRIAVTQKNELDTAMGFIDNVNFRLGRGTFDLSKARSFAFDPNITRLRKMADGLDNTLKVEARGIGNTLISDETIYFDPTDRKMHKFGSEKSNWTRRKQVLYTLTQLEKVGLQQFKPEELRGHREALQQLLEDNEIDERYREQMRDAGINTYSAAAGGPAAGGVEV